MFFVSADNNNGGKTVEQKHENGKGNAHRKNFRKKSGKKFAGKRTDGMQHKERSVKTSFHVVRYVGLGCGNADVIGSYTENSDDEASYRHGIERSVKIEGYHYRNAYINKKCNSKLFCRRKLELVMYDTSKASANHAEDRNEHI